MAKNIARHKNVYLFFIILSIIGFISGYIYYSIQPKNIKENTIENLNIKEELSSSINNIPKRIKKSSTILVCSIFFVTQLFNIFEIFYTPFQIGFIFNLLKTYSFKLSFLYNTIYLIIPFIFSIILIRVSISISINLIKLIFLKDKKIKKHIILLSKKFLLITLFQLFYEFIILIFSSNINSYLMTFI